MKNNENVKFDTVYKTNKQFRDRVNKFLGVKNGK